MTCYDPDAFVGSKPKQLLGRNQQAFVDALKSGRYSQTRYRLRYENGFCATGLAAHITGCEWVQDECKNWVLSEDGEGWPKDFRIAILPQSYQKLYALVSNGSPIQSRNDSGLSFMQITLEIEADPSKFFTESR